MAALRVVNAGFIDHPGTTHAEILASEWQVKERGKGAGHKDCANMRWVRFIGSQDHFCGKKRRRSG